MLDVILNDVLGIARLSEAASSNRSGAFENLSIRRLHKDISLCFHVAGKLLHNCGKCLSVFARRSSYVFSSIHAYLLHGKDYNNDVQMSEVKDCICNRVVFS